MESVIAHASKVNVSNSIYLPPNPVVSVYSWNKTNLFRLLMNAVIP